MIKTLLQILIVSQFLFLPLLSKAQQKLRKESVGPNLANLQQIAAEQKINYSQNQTRALALAKKHNWVISETQPNGSSISLQGLTETGRPIYYVTYNNETSAITTSTRNLWNGGASGLNLTGANPLLSGKLGIWDGGAVRASHQELTGRIINRDGATVLSDHATHVAGTMISRGLNPIAKGMANGIVNLQTWNFNNDGSEIANAAGGLLVSNHSYGNLAGWRLIGANWYWYGEMNVSDKEDVYYGFYNNTSQLWDNIAFNSPYYLMVKAAGNSRNSAEPALGQPYYRYNPTIGNWELVATGRTADMRSYTGYDVIPDHSVAKNILTVGAIFGLENGYTQPADVNIFNTSSWGPTDDGRIKPDLVGSGVRVTSTFASNDDAYNYATGTSMAAPNISGSLILLQEHFANLNNGQFMLAATLKGLALHTAREAGSAPGPDYIHGWGLLNTEQAAQVISNKLKTHQITENKLTPGQSFSQTVKASGLEPLRVTISWTDPAGSILPMVPSTLNNRAPRLVNDLDIRVTSGSQTNLPWILDPNNPAAAATTGDNIRDNVEQILISNPVPGQSYTVTVSHKGTLRNNLQAYSLIISGLQGIQYCASRANVTAGAYLENVTTGKINHTSTNTCSTYSDFSAISTPVEIGQSLSLAVKTGTCDTEKDKFLKIFADWNSDGDFEDTGETVGTLASVSGKNTFTTAIPVPANLVAGTSARLRLVLVEGTPAEMITACGIYEKGETEDYTLNFIAPLNDVGITGLTHLNNTNFTANPEQGLTFNIKNFGSVNQSNIPVSVEVKAGSKTVTTISALYAGTLAPQEEKSFTLTDSFAAFPGTTYTFSATTTLENDFINNNDEFTSALTTSDLTQSPLATASACSSSSPVTLKGTGNGTLFWYDSAEGGNLVAVGNQTTTQNLPASKTLYAVLNQFCGTTATRQNTTPGTFATTPDTVYFDAGAPFTLERFTLHAGSAGTVQVALYTKENKLIQASVLKVIPGVAQYEVNFLVPAAGLKYKLLVSHFGQGATANRNEAPGTLTYPYTLPALLTLIKSSTGSLYAYNWKIKATGVPSARVGVKINGSLVTSASNFCAGKNTGTLTFTHPGTITRWESSTDGLTWTALAHTQSSYSFTNLLATTSYRAIFTDGTCSEIASEVVTVQINQVSVATIKAGGSTKICEGGSVILTASTGSSYLWSTGQTTSQIIVSQAGTYTVQVTNASGCSATSAGVTVSHCLTTWTGTTDTQWENATNWTNGVPDNEMNVTIPANLTRYPVINSGAATCKNLIIQGSLSLSGGIINISENFTKTGTLNQSTDALVQFIGNSNHKIVGSVFQNLRIGGTGNKTLDSDIIITGNLTIVEGTVTTGDYKIILDAAATLTETATNYIIGTVQATRSFKYGTTQTFGNLGLSISTGANPAPTIQVNRVTGLAAPGTIRSVKRYYDVSVTSGKSSSLNATMEFSYLPGELNGFSKDNLALYRSTDQGANWMLQEKSVVEPGANNHKITLNNISAFSVWTASDRDQNLVLPVTLTTFKITKQKSDALITWETTTEQNAAGIEVEVSEDAESFRSLGFVPATGINAKSRQWYQFTDSELNKKGVRYYRLKQTDLNGKLSYYGPKAVNFSQESRTELIAYPNPSKGSFALLAQAEAAEPMQVEIKNLAGQTIYRQNYSLSKGENKVLVNLPANHPAGVYLVIAQYNHTTQMVKMIVE